VLTRVPLGGRAYVTVKVVRGRFLHPVHRSPPPFAFTMDHELPPDLYARIDARAAEGDVLADKGQYEAAVRVYNQAWEDVPEPKHEWR
jgi:hypothetical protein